VVVDSAPELPVYSVPRPAAAVARLAPPDVSGQESGNASVTELAAFARCPRAYYLGHYLKLQPERRGAPSGATPAAVLGTQTHALLAGETVQNPDPEAVEMAERFRRSPLGLRAARAPRAGREFDFLLAVEDLVVSGKVDLWFQEGGEVVLVDYKTDKATREEARERAGEYALQVRLYAMAIERATGRAPSQAWLHFLRPDAAIEVDLSPSLLDAPEQVVRDFQAAQAALSFPLREGEQCRRCPFAGDLCPAPR